MHTSRGIFSLLLVTLLLVGVVGLKVGGALAADVKIAKEHAAEMVKHAKEMVSHGTAGHLDVLSEHAEGMINYAKTTIKNLPDGSPHTLQATEHINTAIAEAEEAQAHGDAGHGDIAVKHAEAALKHAKEAQSHVKGL